MTENETINTLYYLLGHENAIDKGLIESENKLNSQEKEALQSMLKEYRQYRAIGTVKEIKIREAQFARLSEGYLNDLTLLREYQAIGTIEEFKALKENSAAKKAVVRGVMGFDSEKTYYCPNCNERLYTEHFDVGYCNCGQSVKY